MPIYEYRCASCGAELEKLQKISDPPLRDCPECGKDTLVKLVSASSFRLKGSGWYETDFKTGKKKNGTADASDASGDTANSAGGAAPESTKAGAEPGKNAGAATTVEGKSASKEPATKHSAGPGVEARPSAKD